MLELGWLRDPESFSNLSGEQLGTFREGLDTAHGEVRLRRQHLTCIEARQTREHIVPDVAAAMARLLCSLCVIAVDRVRVLKDGDEGGGVCVVCGPEYSGMRGLELR